MKLSVSMIVKNEESCLATCLESVKGADEIVICDTGSTDKTIEIARRYTDKVFTGEEYLWRDDFAFHRNQSLEKCTGGWILIIDADEYLEAGGIEKTRNLISTVKKNCVYVKTQGKGSGDYNMSNRLFRSGVGIHWQEPAHNVLSEVDGEVADITITYAYSEAHRLDPDRTLRILSKAVKEKPTPRRLYYLAREWWYRKKYDKALGVYDRYLKVGFWTPEVADAWLMKARCLWYLNRGNQAREACLKAIQQNPDFKEALRFMAEMHYEPWKSKWNRIADNATNKDVMFIRK